MKQGSKDNSEGKTHQVKDNIQDDIWNIFRTSELKAEGKGENIDRKAQENSDQVEMDVSSAHNNALVVRPVAGPLMLILK
ncbi:MAG: hypothetical protein R6V76_14785 [Desulfobacterales bacterium]